MRTENIQETLDVGVVFHPGAWPSPRWFVWHGRKILVKTVEMTWQGRQGEAALLFFSVTDGATVYELGLNQKSLVWTLGKVHVDG